MKRAKIAVIICCIFILLVLWINSTHWFRFKLANFYELKDRQNKVMQVYEKILRKAALEANSPSFLRQKLSVEHRYNLCKRLADYYFEKGEKYKAIKYYKIVKKLNPRRIEDYLNLYISTQDVKTLINIVLSPEKQHLTAKLPGEYLDTPLWKYKLAIGLAERKRWQESQEVLEELLAEYPYLFTLQHLLELILQKKLPSNTPFEIVGIWNLDEIDNDMTKDSSGRYNHGRVFGAQLAEGIDGNALWFDGIDDELIIPNYPDLDLDGQDFTITMWIKPFPQKKHRFVYRKGPLQLYLNNNGNRWSFRIKDSERLKWLSISQPVKEKWYFVVQRVVQDKEHMIWLFNEEGPVEMAKDDISETVDSDGKSFRLSVRWRNRRDHAFFKGKIDEIIIFSRALTESEIKKLYETNRGSL